MEIFVIGTIWFWVLVAIASGLIIYFLETALNDEYHDTGGGAPSTLIIGIVIALYYFLGSKQDVKDFFFYLKDHPWLSLGRIGIYISIGIIWSVFKWFFFLQNKKEYFKKKMETSSWKFNESDIPQAKRNKARIISWMSYWPFSMLWTTINEPVKKTFRFIYSKIEGVFQKMANSTFSDFKNLNQPK